MTDPAAPPKKRKKPASISPTKRARAELKERGWTSQIVERWNPFAGVRQDLFGVIDIVAMHPSIGILGIQATSGEGGGAHAARQSKIEESPLALMWLRCGGKLEVWSFAKRNDRQPGRRKTWTLRRTRAFVVGEGIGFSEEEA